MSAGPASAFGGWARRRIDGGRTPGVAWWVELDDGGIVERGALGSASIVPSRETLDESTPFDLASLTKQLATAPLTLLLAQDGRLDPDAPIGETLDELRGAPWGERSADELARHVAGLPAWRPLCAVADSLDGYVRAIAAVPPAVARGTTLYSDLGYILLGALVERIGGEPLDVAFERRLARPACVERGVRFARRPWAAAAATESGNRYEREMAGADGASYAWRDAPIRGRVHDANAHAVDGVAGHAGLFGTAPGVAALARRMRDPAVSALGAAARRRWLELDPAVGRSFGMQAAARNAATRGLLPDAAPGHTGFTGTSLWFDPLGRDRGGFCLLLTNRIHPRVDPRSFQPVRRSFHRLVRRIASTGPGRYHGPGHG